MPDDDLPVLDLHDDVLALGAAIDDACRQHGFFLLTGHGIPGELFERLQTAATDFFAKPAEEKSAIAMPVAGASWRGWFPPGGELTSGVPDGKEGLYFGTEHSPSHPRVVAGTPLHGPNQFPAEPAELRMLVLTLLDHYERVARTVLSAMAAGLGLPANWFETELTTDPTILFRIFHYPPPGVVPDASWGVAEHTDYGLLTLLWQDDVGGLQVRSGAGDGDWIDVPASSFVCNIGDMLERMTGGTYRSTPHRVVAPPTSRLSMPFFFDPSWDATITPLPGLGDGEGWRADQRWDGTTVFDDPDAGRTYGDYLTSRVSRVFPDLFSALDPDPA